MAFVSTGGVNIVAECPRAGDMNVLSHSMQVGRFRCEHTITEKQKSILCNIDCFFTEDTIEGLLVPITTQQSRVSLRALDWLVTNFSKKWNTTLYDKNGEVFNIFQSYKDALAHFRRRNFDPFRRRQRVTFTHNMTEYTTTVGQLNFLHWVSHHRIYEFAETNVGLIENDMNETAKRSKVIKAERHVRGEKRKRQELSLPARQTCKIIQTKTQLF